MKFSHYESFKPEIREKINKVKAKELTEYQSAHYEGENYIIYKMRDKMYISEKKGKEIMPLQIILFSNSPVITESSTLDKSL